MGGKPYAVSSHRFEAAFMWPKARVEIEAGHWEQEWMSDRRVIGSAVVYIVLCEPVVLGAYAPFDNVAERRTRLPCATPEQIRAAGEWELRCLVPTPTDADDLALGEEAPVILPAYAAHAIICDAENDPDIGYRAVTGSGVHVIYMPGESEVRVLRPVVDRPWRPRPAPRRPGPY